MKKIILAVYVLFSISTSCPADFQLRVRAPETKMSLTQKAFIKSVLLTASCYLGTCLGKMMVNTYKDSKDPVWNFAAWSEKSQLNFCATLGTILSAVWYEWFEKLP